MSTGIPLSRIRNESSIFSREEIHRSPSPSDVGEIFDISATNDAEVWADIHPPWKRDLYALLEQPTSSSSAFLVHVFMTFLIVISAVVTVLETVPTFHSISGRVWFGFETSLVALFTAEYIGRSIAWSGTGWMGLLRWIFCEQNFNIASP
jgi:potassium voltage-gated channel Shal-related subfamily D protein 2